MEILVNIRNAKEERILLAFLSKRNYEFELKNNPEENTPGKLKTEIFIGKEIEQFDREIEQGNYIDHQDVEKRLTERRKKLW